MTLGTIYSTMPCETLRGALADVFDEYGYDTRKGEGGAVAAWGRKFFGDVEVSQWVNTTGNGVELCEPVISLPYDGELDTDGAKDCAADLIAAAAWVEQLDRGTGR